MVVAFAGIAGVVSCNKQGNSARSGPAATVAAAEQETAEVNSSLDSPLPETQPPPGLPIVPWGRHELSPVIRQPKFLTAEQGDSALARDEPVVGLVIGGEARAYSTNQLNDHEMVVDTLAGTPLLVTY
jgi:hypothetical protein